MTSTREKALVLKNNAEACHHVTIIMIKMVLNGATRTKKNIMILVESSIPEKVRILRNNAETCQNVTIILMVKMNGAI